MCKLWSGHSLTEFSSISVERSPPIEEVISTGVVPRFIEFLTREDHPQLQVWNNVTDRSYCLLYLLTSGKFDV